MKRCFKDRSNASWCSHLVGKDETSENCVNYPYLGIDGTFSVVVLDGITGCNMNYVQSLLVIKRWVHILGFEKPFISKNCCVSSSGISFLT